MSGLFLLFTLTMIIGLYQHADRWFLDKGVLFDAGDTLCLLRPVPVLSLAGLLIYQHYRACDLKKKVWILGILLSGLMVLTSLELLMKMIIHQPAGSLPTDVHGLHLIFSYPSGHAARLCFLFVLAVSLLPRKALPLIILLGAAFLVLLFLSAMHYPSDLVGGVLLGAIVGGITVRMMERIEQKEVGTRTKE